MQKFYFHDATSTVTGTLPGSSTQSATTPNVTATGASTNRAMDDTIGTLQATGSLTTLAQTARQNNWLRRFVSPALAAQTVTAALSGWTLHIAGTQGNSASVMNFANACAYMWRPSTGAAVGTLWDQVSTAAVAVSGTAANGTPPNPAGSSVTCQNGDVLVYEVWSTNVQTMATAYTNAFNYDGTSEISTACYLLAPADLPLATAAATSLVADASRQRRRSSMMTR